MDNVNYRVFKTLNVKVNYDNIGVHAYENVIKNRTIAYLVDRQLF